MSYLQEEVRELFAEAQALMTSHEVPRWMTIFQPAQGCSTCGDPDHSKRTCDLHTLLGPEGARQAQRRAKRARYESNQREHRQAYKTEWTRQSEMKEIVARLRNGERPKRWGKRWLAAAATLGIEPGGLT